MTQQSNDNFQGSRELRNSIIRQRKKTGPSPKYGPNQAKKMVSMRLSPDALNSIKKAAEMVFRDSQADVVEKMTRFFPPESLQRIQAMAKERGMEPNDLVSAALDQYEVNNAKIPA